MDPERRGAAGGGRPDPFRSVDPILIALSVVCWGAVGLDSLGWIDLSGLLALGLYPLFSISGGLGWLTGNYLLLRRRFLPSGLSRGARIGLLFGLALTGPGVILLLRTLAPAATQRSAPLVPFFGLGVFLVFLLVPFVFRPPRLRR